MKKNSFFSSVSVPKTSISVAYDSPILLMGSCFAQNMGKKLSDSKFPINVNPFGIIYNPISVIKGLKRVIKNQYFLDDELMLHNGKWISLDHHGCFSSFDKTKCLERINSAIEETHQHLKKSGTIFLTFGSAWTYEYPDFGIVANCHKIPSGQFEKRLLTVKEIISAFEDLSDELKITNSNIKIVFTVSPVRHIKDGLHENNLSKSVLHLAINTIVAQNDNCAYFPAYELVIDELRDYRFYKDDLVHPTELAINYVWDKFLATYCDEKTIELREKIAKIKAAVNHKPFDFKSTAHQQFITQQIELMNKLSNQYSFLDFEQEKKEILKE
jgi:hypothetical protein